MSLTRTLLWIMIGSLVLAALLGIATIIMPTAFQTQSQILATCLLIGVYTIPAFGCAAVLRKHRLMPVMWSSIIALGLSLGIWLVLVWGSWDWRTEQAIARFGIILLIIGGWGTHMGLLALLRLPAGPSQIARLATLVCVGTLSVLGIAGVIVEPNANLYLRTIIVLLILSACGTLVVPLLAVIEFIRVRTSHETVSSDANVQVTCPRCGTSQHLKTGSDKCRQCNLRIEINYEEPRCTCGYLLYKLQGESCPECGRLIPPDDRWAAAEQTVIEAPPPVQDQPTR